MDAFVTLVRTVVRAFYEDRCIVLMDRMILAPAVRDEELSKRMKTSLKDIHKITRQLMTDQLLHKTLRAEQNGDGRWVNKTYYYIDPKQFVQVVKLRMAQMRSSFNVQTVAETDMPGYECPVCHSLFTTLEATRFFDPMTTQFCCPHDGNLLERYIPKKDGAQERLSRLNAQWVSMVNLLRKVDQIDLPSNRPFENEPTLQDRRLEQQKLEEAEAAAAKKEEAPQIIYPDVAPTALPAPTTQNTIPIWHQESTIHAHAITTSDAKNEDTPRVTLKISGRPASAAAPEAPPSEKPAPAPFAVQEEVDEFEEDSDEMQDADAFEDYYAQYIADMNK